MFFTQGANFMLIAACAFFFTLCRSGRAARAMALTCLCGAALNLKDILVDYDAFATTREITNIPVAFDMISVPVFCMLLLELVVPGAATRRIVALNVIPAVIAATVYAFRPAPGLLLAIEIVTPAYGVVFGLFIIRRILANRAAELQEGSPLPGHAPSAAQTLLLVLCALFLAGWTGACLVCEDLFDTLYYIVSIALYTSLSILVDRRFIASEPRPDRSLPDTAQMRAELIRIFETDRIYLQPELKLTDVARRLGTNRTYLSKLINSEFQMTYSDYVNTYRLTHAARLLTTTDDTLDVVAANSGFSSLSNFRRLFALRYGCTPAQYRKNG